jgi:hypothetical protein
MYSPKMTRYSLLPLKPAPTVLGSTMGFTPPSPPNEPGVWLAAAFNRVGRRIVFRDEDVLHQVVDPRDQA